MEDAERIIRGGARWVFGGWGADETRTQCVAANGLDLSGPAAKPRTMWANDLRRSGFFRSWGWAAGEGPISSAYMSPSIWRSAGSSASCTTSSSWKWA